MKQLTSKEVRNLFLDYFQSKQHMVEPGAPLVPINDDTLLWINSGVAALKRYFDGSVKPKNPRIVNIQKSLRTNDIDNVGKTARHHTFFEMMGNFSIGDYFKKEAIGFAYEFLFSPKWLGLDLEKAYISIHTQDDEAFDIWTKEYNINPSRILRTDDNYWMIGNGPSGPNSEIFIDRGEKYDPEGLGEKLFFEELENDRYIEIWNVVFSQYDAVEGQPISTFKELPQKNIDTGMGFERLISIVQDTESNFETDLFMPLINKVASLTTSTYKENTMAYRVIVDHIRSLVFTLADGAVFSNEGRGYVLRRILRRAVRFGKVLNIEGNFLNSMVDDVIAIMDDFYPYVKERRDMIVELILSEEKRFAKTLSGGEKLLLDTIEASDRKEIEGDVAFKLYDTYGFPIELTQEIAEENGFTVDLEGFKLSLEAQKERARSSRHKTESMGSQQEDILNFVTPSKYLYSDLEAQGTVVGLFVEGKRVDSFTGEGHIIFDQTPFYAESGGQVSDEGTLRINGETVEVLDVKKANGGQHLHKVNLTTEVKMGDTGVLNVNRDVRVLVQKNHSAVHLLQAALQKIVGEHVQQAGSYVDKDYFRFDFSHYEKLSDSQTKEIESLLNNWVAKSLPIVTKEMSLEDAKATGAMALFSENYGDVVRVVTMGDVSAELCGGNHASSTGEIGLVSIISEESVGSGVRRIIGKTSLGAYNNLLAYQNEIKTLHAELKLSPQKTVTMKVEELLEELKELNNNYQEVMSEVIKSRVNEFKEKAQTNGNNTSVLYQELNNEDTDTIKTLVERLKDVVDVVMFVNIKEDSLAFVCGVSENGIKSGYKAGDLVKTVAQITGGNGGGRPNFAQAGGKELSKLGEAKHEIFNKLGINL